MDSVFVAVGAKLIEFDTCGGVPTIFGRGVARNPCGTLVGVSATLGTLQRDNDPNALSHSPKSSTGEN